MSIDLGKIKNLKTVEEKIDQLILLLEQQVQPKQHTQVSAEPDANTIGKLEIQIGDADLGLCYIKLADGTIRSITHSAV